MNPAAPILPDHGVVILPHHQSQDGIWDGQQSVIGVAQFRPQHILYLRWSLMDNICKKTFFFRRIECTPGPNASALCVPFSQIFRSFAAFHPLRLVRLDPRLSFNGARRTWSTPIPTQPLPLVSPLLFCPLQAPCIILPAAHIGCSAKTSLPPPST